MKIVFMAVMLMWNGLAMAQLPVQAHHALGNTDAEHQSVQEIIHFYKEHLKQHYPEEYAKQQARENQVKHPIRVKGTTMSIQIKGNVAKK